MKIIGREKERESLTRIFNSDRAEFLVVYGRRRVGKTYLIRKFFEGKKVVFFNATGMKKGKLVNQLAHFSEQIGQAFLQGMTPKAGSTWEELFKLLTEAIQKVPKNKKIILFLDELPWMATRNSRLLETLDYYWNQHWSNDNRVKLIVCGSSASWLINKIIYNKGGLHNRTTHTIQLEPFVLYETKQFLAAHGFKINNRQVTQLYLVTGGVPYYLSQCNPNLSIDQNIDELAFSKKSFLLQEFDKLFSSLFDDYEGYLSIVRALALNPQGIGQSVLFDQLKISKGHSLLNKLKSLEDCGFIMSFLPYLREGKGLYYKIVDEYTLFYLSWIEPIKRVIETKGLGKNYWEKRKVSPEWRSWSGYAFESICHKHSSQISHALGISSTSVPLTWRHVSPAGSKDQGAQIDLLFDRDDDAISLCEIKYTETPFSIDKTYAAHLLRKKEVFQNRTKTQKQLFLVMISAAGLKKTFYFEELISAVVTLDHLFLISEEYRQ